MKNHTRCNVKFFEEMVDLYSFKFGLIILNCIEDAELICKHFKILNKFSKIKIKANIHKASSYLRETDPTRINKALKCIICIQRNKGFN